MYQDHHDERVYAHLRAHRNERAFTAFELSESLNLQLECVAASLRRLLGNGAIVQGECGMAHKFTLSAHMTKVADDAEAQPAAKTETTTTVEASADEDDGADVEASEPTERVFCSGGLDGIADSKIRAINRGESLEGKAFYHWPEGANDWVRADG